VFKKRILFVGCSFTADSGFTESNIVRYHWPWLASNHFDCYYYNAGIGGSSNDEIFHRTVELTADQPYDLVVIMWSSLGRKWVYFSEPNIDDFTIIHPGPLGLNHNSSAVKNFHKLYLAYFNNQYVSLYNWLNQIICLQHYFKHKKQSYVFIKGFSNLIHDFDNVSYIGATGTSGIKGESKNGFVDISESLKKILDFDNNPDYRILNKIQKIKKLIQQIDLDNCIDFKNFDFRSSKIDLADDNAHPGIKTNRLMSSKLIEHIDTYRLLG
jgi:hypothetical protein